jgi:hypothetical protein
MVRLPGNDTKPKSLWGGPFQKDSTDPAMDRATRLFYEAMSIHAGQQQSTDIQQDINKNSNGFYYIGEE